MNDYYIWMDRNTGYFYISNDHDVSIKLGPFVTEAEAELAIKNELIH